MRKNLLLGVLLAAMAGGAGIYFGAERFTPDAPQPAAVSHLFGQTLADANGMPDALSQWRGKALVINFWATWCAPCVEEMPELAQLQTEVSDKNIQVIGIGIDTAANIAEFSTRLKIGYPLYAAGIQGTDLSRLFGNKAGGLPYTVLLDAQGQIKKTYLGRLKMEQLRQDLAAL